MPASVIFYPSKPARGVPFSQLFHVAGNPCHPFSGGQGQLLKVVPPGRPGQPITIRPSAMPSGAGIQFIATSNVGYRDSSRPGRNALGVWVVQASPQCTGS